MAQSARKSRRPRRQRDRTALISSIQHALLKDLIDYQQHIKDVIRQWRNTEEIPRGSFVNIFSKEEEIGWITVEHEGKIYFVHNDRRFIKLNFQICRAYDRLGYFRRQGQHGSNSQIQEEISIVLYGIKSAQAALKECFLEYEHAGSKPDFWPAILTNLSD